MKTSNLSKCKIMSQDGNTSPDTRDNHLWTFMIKHPILCYMLRVDIRISNTCGFCQLQATWINLFKSIVKLDIMEEVDKCLLMFYMLSCDASILMKLLKLHSNSRLHVLCMPPLKHATFFLDTYWTQASHENCLHSIPHPRKMHKTSTSPSTASL